MSKPKFKFEKKDVKVKTEDTGPSLNDLRENSDQSFKDVIKDLSINEFYTKQDTKQKYNKFITSVVPEKDFNFMSDLVEMPTTSKGYKWILVVLDLATNEFDIEPMKNKTAEVTRNAFKNIVKRGILGLCEISLKTDGGTEFKGAFHKYLEDHGVMHKTAMPYRKQQMGPVESLNKTVARILMTYLNDKSAEIGKDYNDWTDILDMVREEVNSFRKRDLDKLKEYQSKRYFDPTVAGDPEYQIGQYVHWKIDRPTNINGDPINDNKFRMGDRIFSVETRKIVDVLCFPSKPYYRYKLQDMDHVSYSASELKESEKQNDLYIIKKIIGVKTVKKKKYYLCWWKKELKQDATWEPEEQLIEDNMQDYIDEFKKVYNKNKGKN